MNKFTGNYTDIFKLSKQGSSFKLRSLIEAGGPTTSPPSTVPPTTTGAPGGITPVNDNKVRFYLPAASTTFKVFAGSSTGYWRITDGTTTSSVNSNNTLTYYWYIYSTASTLTGMSSSVSKVIELYPTDSAGNYSSGGEINGFSLHENSSNVDAVDFSGCTNILVASMYSNTATIKGFGSYTSSQPSSITEVRAQGVVGNAKTGSGGGHISWTTNYYYAGGIQLQGQQLDAAALDRLYTDLAGTSNDSIMVGGNPGTSSDDPTLATTKGWTVVGT